MKTFRPWLTVSLALILTATALFVGCNKKSSTEPEDGFFPPLTGLSMLYRIWEGNDSFDALGQVVGLDNQTFPGETYTKIQAGIFNAQENRGVILWLDLSTFRQIGFKAAEMYWSWGEGKTAKPNAVFDWGMREVYDQPLKVIYDGDVGDTFESEATARFYFNGDPNDFEDITMKVETTLTSRTASVEVPYGTVNNCMLLDCAFTQTDSWGTGTFDGQYFLHTLLGVVYSDMIPGFAAVELVDPNPN